MPESWQGSSYRVSLRPYNFKYKWQIELLFMFLQSKELEQFNLLVWLETMIPVEILIDEN